MALVWFLKQSSLLECSIVASYLVRLRRLRFEENTICFFRSLKEMVTEEEEDAELYRSIRKEVCKDTSKVVGY